MRQDLLMAARHAPCRTAATRVAVILTSMGGFAAALGLAIGVGGL
jgi:hypothetical protein